MSSTENTYQNLFLEILKQSLIEEPNTNAIKEYLQQNGLVLNDQGEKCLDDFFIGLAQLFSEEKDTGKIGYICKLDYKVPNKLLIGYSAGIIALFMAYEKSYFLRKCGWGGFLLDSNPILFSADPSYPKKEEGKTIKDELEQDKVGLAALAFQATYSKKADPQKFPREGLSDENVKLFLEAESAYRRKFILLPETSDSNTSGYETDTEILYELFTNKTKGFTVRTIPVSGCGFALLIHGILPLKSGKNHEYYIIAIRGTTPTLLDLNNLPNTPGVGAEKWVHNIYRAAAGIVGEYIKEKVHFNPTDVLNNILAEPVKFQTPNAPSVPNMGMYVSDGLGEKFVHQGFLEKATSVYCNLRGGIRHSDNNKNSIIPEFGDGKNLDEVLKIISNSKDHNQHLIITGHSQGASAALLLSAMIRHAVLEGQISGVTLNQLDKTMDLITFGQPSVGDDTFNKMCIETLKIDPQYKHFLREGDLVATVPGDAWAKQAKEGKQAKLFGNILFQKTGKNAIGKLAGVRNNEEITAKIFKDVYDTLGDAHNAAEYVSRVYSHYAPDFIAKWPELKTKKES